MEMPDGGILPWHADSGTAAASLLGMLGLIVHWPGAQAQQRAERVQRHDAGRWKKRAGFWILMNEPAGVCLTYAELVMNRLRMQRPEGSAAFNNEPPFVDPMVRRQ
jgi:hypothetical protein